MGTNTIKITELPVASQVEPTALLILNYNGETMTAEVSKVMENTHQHENKDVLDGLQEIANELVYKGKSLVNNNNFSFSTLPRKTAPNDIASLSLSKRGRL